MDDLQIVWILCDVTGHPTGTTFSFLNESIF